MQLQADRLATLRAGINRIVCVGNHKRAAFCRPVRTRRCTRAGLRVSITFLRGALLYRVDIYLPRPICTDDLLTYQKLAAILASRVSLVRTFGACAVYF